MGEKFIALDCPTEALAKIILGLEPGEEIRYAGDGSTLKAMGRATAPNLPPDKGCWGIRVTRGDWKSMKFTSMVFLAIETFALEDEPAKVFIDNRVDFYYHLRESGSP